MPRTLALFALLLAACSGPESTTRDDAGANAGPDVVDTGSAADADDGRPEPICTDGTSWSPGTAAFREATGLPPLVAATFGAILTTWVTFLPCFLWIFAGAPFIERLRGNRALSAALSAITAAVVGVILNLAVWFGIHTLFEQVREVPFAAGTIDLPVLTSVNWPALALAVGAILAMFRFKAGMLPVLGVCSVLGAAYVMII